MHALARRLCACFAALALGWPAGQASAEEGDACVTSYEQAQQLQRQGKPVRARAELRLCLGSCPTLLAKDCARWLLAVEPQIVHVTFAVRGAGATGPLDDAQILVDGVMMPQGSAPIELDPGHHAVRAEAPGRVAAEREVELEPAATVTIDLRLEPEKVRTTPAPPAQAKRNGDATPSTGGLLLGGAGVLILAGAAVPTVIGHVKRANLVADACSSDGTCSKAETQEIKTLWSIAGVTAGIGGLALGVGTAVFLLNRGPDTPALRPAAWVDPGARAGWLGIQGRF